MTLGKKTALAVLIIARGLSLGC